MAPLVTNNQHNDNSDSVPPESGEFANMVTMKNYLPRRKFSTDGAIALSLFTVFLCSHAGRAAEAAKTNSQAEQKDTTASKPVPAITSPKVKGMKAAIADIEANQMKWNMNTPAPPAAAWDAIFHQLAKEKYKVTLVYNWPIGDQDFGYNQVIRSELEHRFGEGLPAKLLELQVEAKNTHTKQSEQKPPPAEAKK